MRNTFFEQQKDGLLLLARILLMLLFIIFGWSKLTGFSGTVAFFTADGVPLPEISTVIAVVMEFFVGIALLVGFWTRPLALLMALYTLGTALLGHHFWSMTDGARMMNEINFFKNISIIGGLFALAAAGPGRYSIDKR
ncbi:MAG: DoxX family protein [Janthinobacterium lividum]